MPLAPFSLRLKRPDFTLKKDHPLPSLGRDMIMWEPCLFRGRPLVPLKKIANGDIWAQKETGAKSVFMATI